jgi:hypothetical protein
MEEIQFLALPTLLDPRFKKIAFTQRTAADRAVRTLLHEVTLVQNIQHHAVLECGSTSMNMSKL